MPNMGDTDEGKDQRDERDRERGMMVKSEMLDRSGQYRDRENNIHDNGYSNTKINYNNSYNSSTSIMAGTTQENLYLSNNTCPKGFAKMEERNVRWTAFSKRRRILTLNALPREVAPDYRQPQGYWLHVHKVNDLELHPSLLKRLQENQTDLKISLSYSFYHERSKRFFGSTVMGQQVDGPDKQELLRRAQEVKDLATTTDITLGSTKQASQIDPASLQTPLKIPSHDDIFYWYSRIADGECYLIVEVVANEIHPIHEKVILNQYACGWTILHPFGNDSVKEAADDDEDSRQTFEPADLYRGSPRQILFFNEKSDWMDLYENRRLHSSKIQFRLRKHRKLLRAMHLFRENEMITSEELIPGLKNLLSTKDMIGDDKKNDEDISPRRKAKRKHHRQRKLQMISSHENYIISPAKPILAPELSININVVKISIPDRLVLEEALKNHARRGLPNVQKEDNNKSKRNKKEETEKKDDVKVKILSRFLKVGIHNGRTLMYQDDYETWKYLKLDEDKTDRTTLKPPTGRWITVERYVQSEYFAIVFILEYGVRIGPELPFKFGGKDEEEKLNNATKSFRIPVVLGMQTFVPFDGKRLRCRTRPKHLEEAGLVELNMEPDSHRIRIVSQDLIFQNSDETQPEMQPKLLEDSKKHTLYFNMKVIDPQTNEELPDQTPEIDEEESDGDAKSVDQEEKKGGDSSDEKESMAESEEDADSNVDSNSEESDEEPYDDAEENKKYYQAKRRLRKKQERQRKEHARKDSLELEYEKRSPRLKSRSPSKKRPKDIYYYKNELEYEYESDDVPESLVSGNSHSAFIRQRRGRHRSRKGPSRSKYPMHLSPRSDTSEYDPYEEWRHGLNFPSDRKGLLAQSLQAPVHQPGAPRVLQKEIIPPAKKSSVVDDIGLKSNGVSMHELSRTARTRLSRHGFIDVTKTKDEDLGPLNGMTTDGTSSTFGGIPYTPSVTATLIDDEMHSSLPKHEITIQFAAIRINANDIALRNKFANCSSVYFTYQFYTYETTKTDRALLREDSFSKFSMNKSNTSSLQADNTNTYIFVRETSYGRNAPFFAYRYQFDTSLMSRGEVIKFLNYLQSGRLAVDVWDADSLTCIGTTYVPLRQLYRSKGQREARIAHEFECIAQAGCVDDNGVVPLTPYGGVGVSMGFIQVLACNVGYISSTEKKAHLAITNGDKSKFDKETTIEDVLGARREIELPTYSYQDTFNWRNNACGIEGNTETYRMSKDSNTHRPTRRIRARPLSATDPNAPHIDPSSGVLIAGPPTSPSKEMVRRAHTGATFSTDDTSITYDELFLLFSRFRAETPGWINYKEKLMGLLDVPNVMLLEKRLIAAITNAEEAGFTLEEVFASIDRNKDGVISVVEMSNALSLLPGMKILRETEVKMLLKRFPSISSRGKVDHKNIKLHDFIEFVRSKQPEISSIIKLRRVLAKAKLANINVDHLLILRSYTDTENPNQIRMITSENFTKFLVEDLGGCAVYDDVNTSSSENRAITKPLGLSTGLLSMSSEDILKLTKRCFRGKFAKRMPLNELLKILKRSAVSVSNNLNDSPIEEANLVEEFLQSKKQAPSKETLSDALGYQSRIINFLANRVYDAKFQGGEALNKNMNCYQILQMKDSSHSGKLAFGEILKGMEELGVLSATKSSFPLSTQNEGTAKWLKDSLMVASALTSQMTNKEDLKGSSSLSSPVTSNAGLLISDLIAWIFGFDQKFFSQTAWPRECLCIHLGNSSEDLEAIVATFDPQSTGIITKESFVNAYRLLLKGEYDRVDDINLPSDAMIEVYFDSILSGKRDNGDNDQSQTNTDILPTDYWQNQVLDLFKEGQMRVALHKHIVALSFLRYAILRRAMINHELPGKSDNEGFSWETVLKNLSETSASGQEGQVAEEIEQLEATLSVPLSKVYEVLSESCGVIDFDADRNTLCRSDMFEYSMLSFLDTQRYEGGSSQNCIKVEKLKRWFNSVLASVPSMKKVSNSRPKPEDISTTKSTSESKEETKSYLEDETEEDMERSTAVDQTDLQMYAEPVYEFSRNPQVKEVERKIRRRARLAVRQGIDIIAIFRKYDADGRGCIPRSDLVMVLMELGLSLLDNPKSATTLNGLPISGQNNVNMDKIRQRQMEQINSIRNGGTGHNALVLHKGRSEEGKEEEKAKFDINNNPNESLATLRLYRESRKKETLSSLLLSSLRTTYHLSASVGEVSFFEYFFRNPFSHEERFEIMIRDPKSKGADRNREELTCIRSTEEWHFLRKHKPVSVGKLWSASPALLEKTGDLFESTKMKNERTFGNSSTFDNFVGNETISFVLGGQEGIPVPFTYLTTDITAAAANLSGNGLTDEVTRREEWKEDGKANDDKSNSDNAGKGCVREIEVAFVSATHGNIVSYLVLKVNILPLVVDRRLRFYQGEGQIMKRCISYNFGSLSAKAENETNHQSLFVLPLTGNGLSKKDVVVDTRPISSNLQGISSDVGTEILVKYICGPFPSVGVFLLLVYRDSYLSLLREVIQVEVHSRLNLDIHAALGQSMPLEVPITGDRYSRRVILQSCMAPKSPSILEIEKSNAGNNGKGQEVFKVNAGESCKAKLIYRPRSVGKERIHITLIDVDSQELVSAWILTASCAAPLITKTYDVTIPTTNNGNSGLNKRISLRNPWGLARSYKIYSSDENIMRPKYPDLLLEPGSKGYIKLWFAPSSVGNVTREVFLFVNDSNDMNEECFLIKVKST